MDNSKRHTELLDEFYKGNVSAGDQMQLREALESGDLSEGRLDSYYRERWNQAGDTMDSEIQERMYGNLLRKIVFRTEDRKRSRVSKWIITASACAACLVAGIIGTWFVMGTGPQEDLSKLYTVRTEKGQKTTVMLPDGTTVWLNSDSRLSYDMTYDLKERNVSLSGEGYFEVAKDPERPFTVHTADYNVTALGTAFNISSYDSSNEAVTTLVEGKVRVHSEYIDTELTPDQSLTYDRGDNRYVRKSSVQSYTAGLWRNNELVVSPGTTLEKFAVLLERNYNIAFVFKDESIKDYKFEGIIKNSQLLNVLELISISAPVKYSIDDNTVILDRKQ